MKALAIIDVQNDFCEGGSLQVKNSNTIFPYINELVKKQEFKTIITTKDWHPKDHISFAVNHKKQLFSKIINSFGEEQVLWPVHCVQNSKGAQLSPLLDLANRQIIEVRKGFMIKEQCYSAFGTQRSPTNMLEILKQHNITELVVVGLALDYCVGNTALDSVREGFKTTVIDQATRGVAPETSQQMLEKLKASGVRLITFEQYQKETQAKE